MQPNVQPTRVGAESQKSEQSKSDTAIEAVYAIFSGYNGIVSKIIDITTPVGGKWSTRKSTDNSTVMYFSSVLKGLIEPLKHLMFQLGQVNDANLASMFQMVYSLQQIIDQSPPFKMIDIAAYKKGKINYEGLSDDLPIGSLNAYVSLLELRLKGLNTKINTSVASLRPSLASIPANMRKELQDIADESVKDAKEQKVLLEKEIKKAKARHDAGLGFVDINNTLLDQVDEANEALDDMFNRISTESTGQPIVTKFTDLVGNDMTAMYKETEKKKKLLAKYKDQQKRIEAIYPDLKNPDGSFNPDGMAVKDKEQYSDVLNAIARYEGSGICGSGSGKVDNTQQYNSMGRPLSNDQKINNDMINANRNWQVKNNPPHDTPLGNLNPFLVQNEASKYTYEVKLARENAALHPDTNALGADISLLQGPVGGMSGSGKRSKAMMKLKNVAIDEKNDMYAPTEIGTDGFIPEDQENQFKLPDLKPKKKK